MGLEGLQSTLNKILIDKEELRNDIKNIRQAAGLLTEAADIYKKTASIDSSSMGGAAAEVFSERLGGLKGSMSDQAEACERVAKYMETVIAEFDKAEIDIITQIRLFMEGDK